MRIHASGDENLNGVLDEWLVHTYLSPVADFVRLVYPAAELDAVLAATFRGRSPVDAVNDGRAALDELLCSARRACLSGRHALWRRRNRRLICADIGRAASDQDRGAQRAEVAPIVAALSQMAPSDVEILRMSAAIEECGGDRLATILNTTVERASSLLREAEAEFHARCLGLGFPHTDEELR